MDDRYSDTELTELLTAILEAIHGEVTEGDRARIAMHIDGRPNPNVGGRGE